MRSPALFLLIVGVSLSLITREAAGFGYIFASEANGTNIVAHPIGYTGVGGVVNVSVGIDPASLDGGISNTALMAVSVQNVIRTWNALVATTGNVIIDFANLPASSFDFESVLLHELGHSLGLAHNNLGVQTGVSGGNTDFANSTDGTDNTFSFGAGVDGVIGTRDDVRGDDENLNYFRKTGTAAETNNPFTIAGVVDSSTYSRLLADLPVGDFFSGVSSQQNAATFGSVPNNTEAAMNQGTSNNQLQRTLGHDDVAGIRYANSGIDSLAATADDYTLNITYAGITTSADIVIDFDNSQTGFAVSQSSGSFLAGSSLQDIAITSTDIFFNDSADWFYNQVSNETAAVPEPSSVLLMCCTVGALLLRRHRKSLGRLSSRTS
jgi:hypothetical protein